MAQIVNHFALVSRVRLRRAADVGGARRERTRLNVREIGTEGQDFDGLAGRKVNRRYRQT